MITDEQTYDLMIMGSGIAGMSAALFAANRGLTVALCGSAGGLDFSTGFMDLMGVHPVEQGRCWDDPWAAYEAVVCDIPNHPYALVSRKGIRQAISEFCDFLADQGLPCAGYEKRNLHALTPLGTTKPTFRVPASVWPGVVALEKRAPTLIVDIEGLKGFSSRQIQENQQAHWPGLCSGTIAFPGGTGELYPEHLAWKLQDPAVREEVARRVMALGHDTQYIGFPAILGLAEPIRLIEHLQQLTGATIFEIPTLPPSIAGTRLRRAFDQRCAAHNVRMFSQKTVMQAELPVTNEDPYTFHLGATQPEFTVTARFCLLATGRFLAKGLTANRKTIREPVFNLPVTQPASRMDWHTSTFLDPRGHAINQCGLETDKVLRPLDARGVPFHPRLHAAGSILAHNDWMRMKCGAGLSLATALHAVTHICEQCQERP